ncbi:MAG: hypothetical protein ACLVL7_02155 [Anaerotruncus massiliensis (ex Togo et al. 2019)]
MFSVQDEIEGTDHPSLSRADLPGYQSNSSATARCAIGPQDRRAGQQLRLLPALSA